MAHPDHFRPQSLKTTKAALIAATVATLLVGSSSPAAEYVRSVTIANTPVDVNVVKQPGVAITNTPNVHVVANEKRIQAKMVFNLADGVSSQQSAFTIPAGKRLLVDQVAVYARVPISTQAPGFFIFTYPHTNCAASNPSCPIDVTTPFGGTELRIFPAADKTGNNHSETQTINLFSENSLTIKYIRLGATNASFAWAIVTGRLVDSPAN